MTARCAGRPEVLTVDRLISVAGASDPIIALSTMLLPHPLPPMMAKMERGRIAKPRSLDDVRPEGSGQIAHFQPVGGIGVIGIVSDPSIGADRENGVEGDDADDSATTALVAARPTSAARPRPQPMWQPAGATGAPNVTLLIRLIANCLPATES
jgi:hypothetical protein